MKRVLKKAMTIVVSLCIFMQCSLSSSAATPRLSANYKLSADMSNILIYMPEYTLATPAPFSTIGAIMAGINSWSDSSINLHFGSTSSYLSRVIFVHSTNNPSSGAVATAYRYYHVSSNQVVPWNDTCNWDCADIVPNEYYDYCYQSKVFSHETGHVLGLAHAIDDPYSIMQANYSDLVTSTPSIADRVTIYSMYS